jgi:phage tail-like protein
MIRTQDQWLRASYSDTALEGETVQLSWRDDKPLTGPDEPFLKPGEGLVFDRHCRLYRSVPDEGRVERLLWVQEDRLRPTSVSQEPVNIFASGDEEQLGDFSFTGAAQPKVMTLRALAVDDDQRLFVADSSGKRILIYDLWSRRLLRAVPLAAEPLDMAAAGRAVYVLLAGPAGLIQLTARSEPHPRPLPGGLIAPACIAISPKKELFVLDQRGEAQAHVVSLTRPAEVILVPFATDIEFQATDQVTARACTAESCVLVIARRAGESFRRFCVGEKPPAELLPITADNYQGLGIVRTPEGRIGFWTKYGFRQAVSARRRYWPEGAVTTFRLDSGEFQTNWGRLFLDACIPKDSQIVVRCITADEPPEDAAIPRSNPRNIEKVEVHRDDLSPPMPPDSLNTQLKLALAQTLHRRASGRELPWVRPAPDDQFETYEAPVMAGPGRYLWLRLELNGNTRTTPRFKALRVEYPGHDYLRRIPKMFSRDEGVASFLQRYLAIFEGVLGELEAKADARAALLDPRSAPAEILPWLASFVGLLLDERMAHAPRPNGTEDVRRTLIAQATWLFRFRGTIPGLSRFLKIYLGIDTILIEKYRTRGLGGAIIGDPAEVSSSSVLGAGFRVGGAIGTDITETLSGSVEDAFETHAHRFSVVIPALLTTEQQEVVRQILEFHRPAHTIVEVCTVGAGMRVGRGLHVELTSIVGRSGGFTQLQLGASTLGRGSVVGRPEAGTVIGGSRIGKDSRAG